MFEQEPYPNGSIVTVLGTYRCIGQICDHKDGFLGRRYEVLILESDLFEPGDLHTIVEDLLAPAKDYKPKEKD